jgi:hypothetical protein
LVCVSEIRWITLGCTNATSGSAATCRAWRADMVAAKPLKTLVYVWSTVASCSAATVRATLPDLRTTT